MSFNAPLVSAMLSAETVGMAMLYEFHFGDGILRLWDGVGKFQSNDLREWHGLTTGDGTIVGSVAGLERMNADVSNSVTFTLSGIDAGIKSKALNSSHLVTGRDAFIYAQFFADHTPVGSPTLVSSLVMDLLSIQAEGTQQRSISLSCENIFASKRRRPKASLYTNSDQRARFPADRGFEHVAAMVNKTVLFPNF